MIHNSHNHDTKKAYVLKLLSIYASLIKLTSMVLNAIILHMHSVGLWNTVFDIWQLHLLGKTLVVLTVSLLVKGVHKSWRNKDCEELAKNGICNYKRNYK